SEVAVAMVMAMAMPGPGPGPGPGSFLGARGSPRRPWTSGASGLPSAICTGITAASVDVGCVRLTERHLHGDPPTAAETAAAVADIDAALDVVAAAMPAADAHTLVGLAGSVTTVAGLALRLPGYDAGLIHHSRIRAEEVSEQTRRLLRLTRAERAALGVM